MTKIEILVEIYRLEDTLRSQLVDEMDIAAERVEKGEGRYDDYAEQDDGSMLGIVFPENCAPDLDAAIDKVREASEAFADSFTAAELEATRKALKDGALAVDGPDGYIVTHWVAGKDHETRPALIPSEEAARLWATGWARKMAEVYDKEFAPEGEATTGQLEWYCEITPVYKPERTKS